MYITILVKQVYWYISQVSGERLQDHWSSGFMYMVEKFIRQKARSNAIWIYMYFTFGKSFDEIGHLYMNRIFVYAKTKAQIRFAVTAKLISAFVFAKTEFSSF